jgi:multidrug transporter EmrE-like cation transporter
MKTPSLPPIIWLVLSGIFFAGGEYLSKSWVLSPRPLILFALTISYMTGVIFWLPALKQRPELAITGTLWSVITLLITVAMGVFLFGESISSKQILGILFAIAAVVLLSA